jgi:hypothetical protein
MEALPEAYYGSDHSRTAGGGEMGRILRLTVVGLLFAALAGCVYAPPPAGYAYGYGPGYGYAPAPAPYYYGPPVTVGLGFGGCWHCGGWHHWR